MKPILLLILICLIQLQVAQSVHDMGVGLEKAVFQVRELKLPKAMEPPPHRVIGLFYVAGHLSPWRADWHVDYMRRVVEAKWGDTKSLWEPESPKIALSARKAVAEWPMDEGAARVWECFKTDSP